MASSKQASRHSPCERPRRAGRRPSPRTPACHTRARCGAAGPGALQLCVLWRCGAQPEGRTAATPRHGPWWPSHSLLSELACREVGHSVVEHGHALVVCGVERYFSWIVPGWSRLVHFDQSAGRSRLVNVTRAPLQLPFGNHASRGSLFPGPGSPEPATGLRRQRVAALATEEGTLPMRSLQGSEEPEK